MLPQRSPAAFHFYIDHCPGFEQAIWMLLLCLRRHRFAVPREVGMEIVAYVAEGHRREMWWPIVDFDVTPYI